ncbi:MAG: S-layer homology domain-containing protein, partial [Oscillospiraceae bacterium]|nr:S-layer homology domain-containing protein [Oscillospiraceae bacterium]
MRNLKKVVALMLVGVLSLALLIPGAGAYVYPDQSQINAKYVPAINMLYELAIMQGNNGEFRPVSNLTRAEFSKMVYVVANRGSTNANNYQNVAEVSFQDYVSTDWFAGYVNWAAVQGVVEGKSPTRFDPQGNVTGYEAAKMLLVVLGYRSNIEGYTGAGWTLNVLSDAQGAGLLDDLEDITDFGAPLTREQAAQILYNAIFAGMVEYKEQPSGWVVTSRYVPGTTETQVETPAHLFFTLETLTGTYTANEWVAIGGSAVADEGKIRLVNVEEADGDTYSASTQFDTTLGLDLLGQKITVYVRLNTKGEVSKIYGTPVPTNEETIFYAITSDLKASGTAPNTVLTYTTGGKDYKTDSSSRVYQNYISVGTSGITAEASNPVKIIVDSDGNIDYALITRYAFRQISVSSSGKITAKAAINGTSAFTSLDKGDIVIGNDLAVKDTYVLAAPLGSSNKWQLVAVELLTATVSSTGSGGKVYIEGQAYTLGDIDGAELSFAFATGSIKKEKTYFKYGSVLLGATTATSDPLKYAVISEVGYSKNVGASAVVTVEAVTATEGTKVLTIGSATQSNGTTDLYASGASEATVTSALLGKVFSYSISGTVIDVKAVDLTTGNTAYNTNGAISISINPGSASPVTKRVDGDSIFFAYFVNDGWVAYLGRSALPTLGSVANPINFSYLADRTGLVADDTITIGVFPAGGADAPSVGTSTTQYKLIKDINAVNDDAGDLWHEYVVFDPTTESFEAFYYASKLA